MNAFYPAPQKRKPVVFSRTAVLLFISCLLIQPALSQPVINSLSPQSGPAGTAVTISGSNFSPVANNNFVYFGAARAEVTSASAGSLTVMAPAGSNEQPVTVTVSGLTAYWDKPFNVTFPGGTASFNNESFAGILAIPTPNFPVRIFTGDLNADGKPDLASSNTSGSISLFINDGNAGNISFEQLPDLSTGSFVNDIVIADIDGDGKQDLIATRHLPSRLSIYRNTGTGGTVSFDSPVDFPLGNNPRKIAAGDVNGDGKTDLAVVDFNDDNVSLFRNTTSGTAVSFAEKLVLSTGSEYPGDVLIRDLDGDRKPDLVVAHDAANSVAIFRNTSPLNTITFDNLVNYEVPGSSGMSIADLDGDNKPDIAIGSANWLIWFLENHSTSGNISFTLQDELRDAGWYPSTVATGDLTGDGKPDMVGANMHHHTLSLYKNISSPSLIDVEPKFDIGAGNTPRSVVIADFDGDGRPDIAVSNENNFISILRNRINEPAVDGFSPASGKTGTVVTITGKNFTGATSVNFGVEPAASFIVVSETAITATVGNGASGDVSVITPGGTAYKTGFTYYALPVINSFTPTTGTTGTTVTITGNYFASVSSVKFGDVNASSFQVVNATTITAMPAAGASGDVSVTTPGGTASLAGFIFVAPQLPTITGFSPGTGTTGTVVTISGTNFVGVTAVRFGGTSASSYVVNNDGSITAVVDTGSTGSVSVTTAGGTATLSGFVFAAPQQPSITAISPSGASTGDLVTITGTHFTGASAVSFGGTNATSFTVLNETTIQATLNNGSPGEVRVVTPGGIATYSGFNFTAPIVTGFTPASGPTGSTVIINGSGFDALAQNNSVYFGGAKAVVVSATTNALEVIVPQGAGFSPISVTAKKLTAFSRQPFNITFAGIGSGFSSISFANKIDIASGHDPYSIVTGDLDGDGQSDLAVAVRYTGYVSVYKNTSTTSLISFAPKTDYPTGNNAVNIKLADINGDGKPDLIVANSLSMTISALKNTSTNGNISFAAAQNISITYTGSQTWDLSVDDIDGDGKPDIVAANFSPNMVSVYRNTSVGENISFDTKIDLAISSSSESIALGDLDGDGKPDIAVTNNNTTEVSLFRNTSTPGVITFASKEQVTTPFPTTGVAMADMDGDNRYDLIVTNYNAADFSSQTVSIFRNNSSPGTLGFAPKLDIPLTEFPHDLTIANLDGDDKPEIIAIHEFTVSVLKNQSTAGTVSFAAPVAYATGVHTQDVAACDLDGDDKPEIIAANANGNLSNLSILRNSIGDPLVVSAGASPVTGDIVSITRLDEIVQVHNGIPYVQRHFDLEPVNNPATATAFITLYFSQQDFNNYNSHPLHGPDLPTAPDDAAGKSNLRVYQYHGVSASGIPGTYSGGGLQIDPDDNQIVWNPAMQWWEISFNVTGFSGFFVSTGGTEFLPLTLLSFNGALENNSVLLKWTTSQEQNVDHFEILRSNNGSDFVSIAKVAAAGNTTGNTHYHYSDAPGNNDIYYYRLKMTDINGASRLSHIIRIRSNADVTNLTLYPNPASEYVIAEHPAVNRDAVLKLVDMYGRIVSTTRVSRNALQTQVRLTGLPGSTYRLVWTDGIRVITKTLIINK